MKIRCSLRNYKQSFGLLLVYPRDCLRHQSTGSVEFTAQVAPTDGRPSLSANCTFYPLAQQASKTSAGGHANSNGSGLDKFVDGLSVLAQIESVDEKRITPRSLLEGISQIYSPRTISWTRPILQCLHVSQFGLRGERFSQTEIQSEGRSLQPEKFNDAKRVQGSSPQIHWQEQPDSIPGIDAGLTEINPSRKMGTNRGRPAAAHREAHAGDRSNPLFGAQTDTNLDGRGIFAGLAPGRYWIDILGMQAISGDVRLRWISLSLCVQAK